MFQSFRQSIKRTANTIQIRSQLPNTAICDLFFSPLHLKTLTLVMIQSCYASPFVLRRGFPVVLLPEPRRCITRRKRRWSILHGCWLPLTSVSSAQILAPSFPLKFLYSNGSNRGGTESASWTMRVERG